MTCFVAGVIKTLTFFCCLSQAKSNSNLSDSGDFLSASSAMATLTLSPLHVHKMERENARDFKAEAYFTKRFDHVRTNIAHKSLFGNVIKLFIILVESSVKSAIPVQSSRGLPCKLLMS